MISGLRYSGLQVQAKRTLQVRAKPISVTTYHVTTPRVGEAMRTDPGFNPRFGTRRQPSNHSVAIRSVELGFLPKHDTTSAYRGKRTDNITRFGKVVRTC
jgi:hypothetical protein